MTQDLFRADAYRTECSTIVTAITPQGIVLERTVFYLQPCGGTHVANTAEIGRIIVTKIEKKSANTRRVVLGFAA